MKPAPFRYEAARTLHRALALLGEPDARALAGGQSLIPVMNFRLARPALLVDLNPIDALAGIRRSGGRLRIGALTRHAALERSALIARHWPLLAVAARHVGHPAIRTRGTIGGSVAHADPKAELPVALTALDAVFHLRSPRGDRTLSADQLFRGPMMTALGADELVCAIELPAPPAGARMAFCEFAATAGDWAQAGAAVVLAGREHAAIALLGAGSVPVRATGAERALRDGATAAEAAQLAVEGVAGDHRRAVLHAMVTDALREAGA